MMFYLKIPLSFMPNDEETQKRFLRRLSETGVVPSFATSDEDFEKAQIVEEENKS